MIMVMTIKRGSTKDKIENLIKLLTSTKEDTGINAYQYCGILKLKESPNEIQKRLRDEWD